MGRLRLNVVLDGQSFREPIEWRSLGVRCVFDNGAVQPSINLNTVTFVNEAKDYITRMFAASRGGAVRGPYQGMPVQFYVTEGTSSRKIFDGYIDFKNEFSIKSPVEIKCKLVQLDSLDEVDKRTRALSFGYLDSLGYFKSTDFTIVETIVIPFDRDMQFFQLAFYEFILIYQGYQVVRNIETDLALNIVTAVVAIAIDVVFLGLLLVQIYKITKKLFDLLSPVPILNKAITWRKGFQKICQRLGYQFNTTIADIDWVYLPSNPDIDSITKGIPHIQDFGYNCADFINEALLIFNARMAIVNGVMEVHNIAAPFWQTLSTYKIPPVLFEEVKWNIGDLIANKVFYFETDNQDEYTIKNYSGTNCEVITSEIVPGNPRYSLVNGFKKQSFNMSLGNNHNPTFDPFAVIRGILQQFLDLLESIASKSTALRNVVNGSITQINALLLKTDKQDLLVVSAKSWSKPKLLWVKNGRLPANHRSVVCAAEIYRRYHSANSMIPSNPFGQKRLYEKVRIPFQFSNFIELLNCSYAVSYKGGKQAKVESLEWKFDQDEAEITYWINDVFDNNIKENVIAP